jgi:hypothetical protein
MAVEVGMHAVRRHIVRALRAQDEAGADDDEAADLFAAEVDALIATHGRGEVVDAVLAVLTDQSARRYWYEAAAVLFGIVADLRRDNAMGELPCPWSALVATLYRCLESSPGLGRTDAIGSGDNLVWSIAHLAKGVSYTSAWNPLEDPEVLACLRG